MRRGGEDTRPPIELLGIDPGITSTQQVSVGAGERTPRRGRALAVAVAAVAVLGGGLALGDGDDDAADAEGAAPEERDNADRTDLAKPLTSTTVRRTTTTRPTTTTTLPTGPPFGIAVEGALVLSTGSSWQVVDLATGEEQLVSTTIDSPSEAVSVQGGVVGLARGEAVYQRLLGVAEDEEARPLGPANQVFRAVRHDQVWLVSARSSTRSDPAVDVRLVDLHGGGVVRSFTAPGRWVVGVTDAGALVARGGRVYRASERGVDLIASGWVMSTGPTGAVLLVCDEAAECAVGLLRGGDSAPVPLFPVPDPDDQYYEVEEGPDGQLLVIEQHNGGSDTAFRLFDGSGESLGEIDTGAFLGMPTWLPSGLGLVASDGSGLRWARQGAGGVWEAEPVPRFDGRVVESLLVVTP